MDYVRPLPSPLAPALGFLLLALVVKLLLQRLTVSRILRPIPGPCASSIIWGEEWLLYHSQPGSQYVEWHRDFGKVVKFTGALGHQALSITDCCAISNILGENAYNFPKPDGVRAWFKATLGEGVVWAEGKELHGRLRRMLAPALSPQSVRNLTPIFHDTAAKLATSWLKLVDDSNNDQVEIEVTSWAGRFALDTVILATFSYDCGFLSGQHESLLAALDGLTNNEHKTSSFYMRALFWVFPSILSIGKKGEMIRQTKRELGKIATMMWGDAKIAGDEGRNNLATLMLKTASEWGDQVDEEETIAQMRTIISAGYETVSATVAWVLYELAIHFELQSRLREEILMAGGTELSMDQLNSLPLLDAVLRETLRLHPPIIENHHQAAETISVPLSQPLPGSFDTHLVIPKGTIIAIPVNVVHSDPSVYGPDACHFRPDRWLEGLEGNRRHGRELFAFSEGPRACIGRTFALTEIKVLVTTLLPQFAISCDYEIEPFQSFVVRPRVRGDSHSSLPLTFSKL